MQGQTEGGSEATTAAFAGRAPAAAAFCTPLSDRSLFNPGSHSAPLTCPIHIDRLHTQPRCRRHLTPRQRVSCVSSGVVCFDSGSTHYLAAASSSAQHAKTPVLPQTPHATPHAADLKAAFYAFASFGLGAVSSG